jgi:hypothetical protein
MYDKRKFCGSEHLGTGNADSHSFSVVASIFALAAGAIQNKRHARFVSVLLVHHKRIFAT